MIQATLIIKGKVQMVGYRVVVKRIAQRMGLIGYVENISNGNVKVVCEGEIKDIDDFIKLITIKNDTIFVENIEKKQETATGEFKEFTVKNDDQSSMHTIIELISAQNEFALNMLKGYEKAFEQLRAPMVAAAQASEYLSNLLLPIQQVQNFIYPSNLMIDQSAIKIYEQQARTMTAVAGCIETYPNLVLPTEMLISLREQEQPLLKEVLRENQERELLPDTERIITEIQYHIENLPIFDKQKELIKSGIESYKSNNFPSAFSTLLDTVEGVVREVFVSKSVGGADVNTISMVEQLRNKKWLRHETESSICGLERSKAQHALGGEYTEFPQSSSENVLMCFLKLARDNISFKALRLCFQEIIKQPQYSKFTIDTLLSDMNNIHRVHVDTHFTTNRLTLLITLFSRNVFEFECKGPLWDAVTLIKNL